MEKLTDYVKQIFFQLLNSELIVKDFEKWIYNQSNRLEEELEANIYLDLLSIDYNKKDTLIELKNKLSQVINNDEFNIWRTKRLLLDIIEHKIDLVVATRKLRQLYQETGENFIPITLGIGYESELDDVPIPSEYEQWETDALNVKLKKVDLYKVDLYKDNIINDAKEFLKILTKK